MASKGGVGNALLYIGLPWHKRKSYARDSAGFERVEDYFRPKNIEESGTDTESDSSETDTEELLRQAKQDRDKKRIEANARKRAVTTIKQKAATRQQQTINKPLTTTKQRSDVQTTTNSERPTNEHASVQSSDSGTAEDMDADDDVIEISSPPKRVEAAQLYSPKNVGHSLTPVVSEPPTQKSSKLLPSRLTFSASSNEEEVISDRTDTPKSTRSRGKTRHSAALLSKQRSQISQALSTASESHSTKSSSPPIPDSDPIPDIAGETEVAGSSSGIEVDAISLGNDLTVFDPPKNSTEVLSQGKSSSKRKRKSKTAVRKVSSIPAASQLQHLTDSESSSDSEKDETLRVFLRENVSPFHGLSRLAKQRATSVESGGSGDTPRSNARAMSEEGTSASVRGKRKARRGAESGSEETVKSKVVGKKSTSKKTAPKKRAVNSDTPIVATKTSTVKRTTATNQKETETKKRARNRKALKEQTSSKRKSVTFMTNTSSSEHEDKNSNAKQTSRVGKRKRENETVLDINDEISVNHTRDKISETPPRTEATPTSDSNGSKRKSILKNVSVVLTRAVSSPPGNSSSWFVPPDPSRISRKDSDEYLSKLDTTENKRRSTRSTAKQMSMIESHHSVSTHSEMAGDSITVNDDPMVHHDVSDRSDDNDRGLPIDSLRSPRAAVVALSHVQYSRSDEESRSATSSSLLSSAGSKRTKSAGSLSADDVSVLPKLKKRKRKANLVLSNKRKIPKTTSQPQDDIHVYSFSSDEDDGGLEITESPGGRKYRRLRVQGAMRQTPGVRRSQRTRIAPVKHWLNEQPEYNMKRRSGISLKGVLIPMDDDDIDEDLPKPKRKKPTQRKGRSTQMKDEDYPPLKITDEMGNESEMAIVHTLLRAAKMDCTGKAPSKDSEVVISQLTTCGKDVAVGHLAFSACGEKSKCVSSDHSLLFYVIKGELHFQVNGQDFRLHEGTTITVPPESVYGILNLQRSKAELLYITVFKN